MAALSTVAAVAAVTAAVGSVAYTLSQKPPKPPAPPELPKPPSEDVANTERQDAIARIKRRRAQGTGGAGRTSTLLTGAGGLTTPATTERKTLLGS